MTTDRLDMKSIDFVSKNIESIAELFPNCITETSEGKRIDFTLLQQELSGDIVDGAKERYRLEWAGKREAIVNANLRTTNTLRPIREDSVDFDKTENIYIEGDNLEVLKILQESYLNKIKMIYIDPPYNTGNDFIYKDDFKKSVDELNIEEGNIDEQRNRLVANSNSSGRYHSDWLSMMYPRLKLARNLLTEDGVIFISIDDNEVHNLRKICDEIFGEMNFVSQFPWRKRTAKSDVPYGVSQDYEWLICFSKSDTFRASIEGKGRKYYETSDFPGKPWRIHDMTKQTTASERPNSFFTMINPKNGDEYPADPNRTWRITKDTFQKYYDANEIIFPGDYDFLKISKPVARYFKHKDMEKDGDNFGRVALSTKLPDNIGMSQDGTKEMKNIFENIVFPFPKPINLIKYISTSVSNDSDIILDFFSGSATTAHAVMQLNSEDGGNRKFIMVQIPEECDEKSEAFKAGYKNICEIGKERIRRAGKKIIEEQRQILEGKKGELNKRMNGQMSLGNEKELEIEELRQEIESIEKKIKSLDCGFRVFRLDSSNMKDVYYMPKDYKQENLELFATNIKEDRETEDLVAQVMLDWGLELSKRIEKVEVAGKEVYKIEDNALYCCFDEEIDKTFIRELAKQETHPLRIVFKDSSFKDDTAKENVAQLIKQLCPETEIKVI